MFIGSRRWPGSTEVPVPEMAEMAEMARLFSPESLPSQCLMSGELEFRAQVSVDTVWSADDQALYRLSASSSSLALSASASSSALPSVMVALTKDSRSVYDSL